MTAVLVAFAVLLGAAATAVMFAALVCATCWCVDRFV